MVKKLSTPTRGELVRALRERYMESTKKEKTKILDEFSSVAGYHRKHAVRLLGRHSYLPHPSRQELGRRIYNAAVGEALIIMWEAADRICGKRLKAILPNLVDAMERHGHICLDPEVHRGLLAASAATLDRLLRPIRKEAKYRKKKRGTPKKVSRDIRVRTFSDWNDPPPGFLEIDFVEHNGGSTAGSYVHTLVAVDICSEWIECVPLLAKSQALVVEALEIIRRQMPFPVLGIDSDNDTSFINETLLEYCKVNRLELTRSRAYRKNDQAWIEQKNGAVIRRFIGHDRYSGIVAGQALALLCQAVRFYVNFFQPSFKLLGKEKIAAKVKRCYDKPVTPCERLLSHPAIDISIKEKLQELGRSLDPVGLLHRIREQQSALAALVDPENNLAGPGRRSLEQFMKEMGQMWRLGEVRPTHRAEMKKSHYWRTRKDPFESVWPDILLWLQDEPDATSKDLFERLQKQYPDCFPGGQLRTLQRRMLEWRKVMARGLVYAGLDALVVPSGITPVGLDRSFIPR